MLKKLSILLGMSVFVLSVFVGGCGEEKTFPEVPSENPPFPHPDGWMGKESHGIFVIENGSGTCKRCHGDNLEGSPYGYACNTCHLLYPHKEGFRDISVHGRTSILEGKESCSGCHGADYLGGDTGVSCFTCHPLYPHADTWLDGHRTYLKEKNYSKSTCATSCHGSDLRGGDSGVSCKGCHSAYPHRIGWTLNHKYYIFEVGGIRACATSCHGSDFGGGSSGISCSSCHSSFPHTPGYDNWSSSGHGLYLQTKNFDNSDCYFCHGSNLNGGTSGVSCYSCHNSYPHPEGKWLTKGDKHFHGASIFSKDDLNNCSICHGSDFEGAETGVSCYSCHSNYPHPASWGNDHGDEVIRNSDSTCRGCHEDLKASFSLNEVSFPACQYCH